MKPLTSVQRRTIQEQTIKADVLRDWIEKLREAFDRTMFYKNFIEGLAVEALEEYMAEHPEDRERAENIREPIRELVRQAQAVNKIMIDIDQRIGRPTSVEKAAAEEGGVEAAGGEVAAPEAEGTPMELPEMPAPEAEAPAGEEEEAK